MKATKRRVGKRRQQQSRGGGGGSSTLEDKTVGGRHGFALTHRDGSTRQPSSKTGLYSTAPVDAAGAPVPRQRVFGSSGASHKSTSTRSSRGGGGNSIKSRSSASSATNTRYATMDQSSIHIVCAISENLAKETCVASLDAGSPVSLQVVKQGNGQTYEETLAYLDIMQPDEILLNEGRRNSPLAQKIMTRYGISPTTLNNNNNNNNKLDEMGGQSKARHRNYFEKKGPAAVSAADMSGPCETATVVKFIPRSYFDQTKGAELLRRIARPDSYDATVVEEYILLSSSYAVLQYTQHCLGANFSKNCLHLSVNAGGRSRMAIDRSSLIHLELLANAKTGKMANSLIGTFDCTKTTVGSRLLRSNIMAPPTDIDTINTRLDLVEAFTSDEEFFYAVMDHLEALPDVNRMLAGIVLSPRNKGKKGDETTITPRIASKGISALVYIKSVLSALPSFAQILEDHLMTIEARERADGGTTSASSCTEILGNDVSSLLIGLGEMSSTGTTRRTLHRHHLLRAMIWAMRQPELNEVLEAVNDIFTDSTSFVSKADSMRHQECFALKPKTDGMLDVLRTTFLANVDDIFRLADEYAEQFEVRVQVKHSIQRGYFLAIPAEIANDLPDAFIQPVKAGRYINCTTEEVHSLNSRAQDNIQDLLLLTHEHIQEVLDFAREKYDALASLSDTIALLDLCHAFADNVASSRLPWTRPVVTVGNDLTIRNGRYGIEAPSGLGTQHDSVQFVPNHTYAPGHRNFVVLTGANGSGKSTYLKQLAIICVLAHCGSFVPAEKAIVPVRDRLCTRIGIADDQEHNISTFLLEMKEIAFICRNASPSSLILIDELGRATSNEDGVAIAWAVSEHLRSKQATTFFVTHYPQLTKLADVYPGIWNQHMGAHLANDGRAVFYSHTIQNGPCQMGSNYGVEISASCGWPEDVVESAREIRLQIEELLPDCTAPIVVSAEEIEDKRRKNNSILELCKQLKTINDAESDERILREQLEGLRQALMTQGGTMSLSTLRSVFRQRDRRCVSEVVVAAERQENLNTMNAEESCNSSLPSNSSNSSDTEGSESESEV